MIRCVFAAESLFVIVVEESAPRWEELVVVWEVLSDFVRVCVDVYYSLTGRVSVVIVVVGVVDDCR